MSVPPPVGVVVREGIESDEDAIGAAFEDAWGGPIVVSHGVTYDLRALPTYVAVHDEGRGPVVAGVLSYVEAADGLEVVAVSAVTRSAGVGSALLAVAETHARRLGLPRLWLVTTNDNLDALRFYQRRGLRIVGVAPGAADEARRAKAAIPGAGAVPPVGDYNIPIRDELTLERRFD
jgi:ribosomal protein S18 acetylase RimI-like enzyme